MGNIENLFRAFGFRAVTVDGHSVEAVEKAIVQAAAEKDGIPKCIVLDTMKGKGWSVTEGKTGIHHIGITDEMMAEAEKEFAGKEL